MDLDSVQADLNALRKLYGLLQINGSGEQSAMSEILDEGSRIFLRNLLDGAAERVFEAHIKIMADNWRSLLGTKCLGQLEESRKTEMLQPSIPSYAAKSPDFDQNIKESVGALLLKDKQPLEFKLPNKVPSVTSRLRRFAKELQSRKKRCLACEQGSELEGANRVQSADEDFYSSNELQKAPAQASDLSIPDQGLEAKQYLELVRNSGMLSNEKISTMECKSTNKEPVACSASSAAPKKEVEDKASNLGDFSKEVDDAIRRIESLIPSLHRLAKPVQASTGKKMSNPDSFRKTTSVLDLGAVGSSSGRTGGLVIRSEQSPTRHSKQAYQGIGNKLTPMFLHPQQRNDYQPLKEDEFEEEVKLLKNTASQTQLIPKTHQLVSDIASEQDGGRSKDYKFLQESLDRIQGEFGLAEGKHIQRTSESSGPNSKAILGKMETLYGDASQNDNTASQTSYHIRGMSILPSQFNADVVNQYQSCQREVRRKTPTREIVDSVNQGQYRRDVFPEKSRKKNNSQENSCRPPQGNHLPQFNESEEMHSDSPSSSTWTTVEASSFSSSSGTTHNTTSYGDENEDSGSSISSPNYQDVNSDSSGTSVDTTSQSSSRYDPSSNSFSDYKEADLSPSEYYQSSHHSIQHRKAGRFKRLRNKLGLIFHHHHHHHHHHHNKTDESPRPVWKQLGRMFKHSEKRDETKNPKAGNGNSRKGKHLAKSGAHKKQIGHFHALVEGLMSHVRHSKKPKMGDGRGKKKTNLWQNRVKVNNKTRVKLQGRGKKPKLTAPR